MRLLRLASGLLALSSFAAPLAAQSVPRLQIFVPPNQNGLRCIAEDLRVGPDSIRVTRYEFSVPGEVTPDRDLRLEIDSAGRIGALIDMQVQPPDGDTSIMTTAAAGWVNGPARGLLIVARASTSAVAASVDAAVRSGNFTLPSAGGTTRVTPARPLTVDELDEAKRLADWLFARRCPVGPPRRPLRP